MNKSSDVLVLTIDHQIDRRILNAVDTMESSGLSVNIQAPFAADRSKPPAPVAGSYVRGIFRRLQQSLKANLQGPMGAEGLLFLRRVKFVSLNVLRQVHHQLRLLFFSNDRHFSKVFERNSEHVMPRLVIANDLPTLPYGVKIAKLHGVPLVYDSHELFTEQEFSPRDKKQWEIVEQKYIYNATSIITVNESIRDELRRRYNLAEVNVVMNAENPARKHPENIGFADTKTLGRKVVLYQGGFSPGRFLTQLVQAGALISDPEALLVFLGSGSEEVEMVNTIKQHELQDRVLIHPAVPQEQLLNYTATAYLGVIPYKATCLNNKFATPNKMFEFVAAGLPFVGTELPEIAKIVNRYKIGLVGNTDTPQAMADLINTALEDKQRYQAWKKNMMIAQREVSWDVEGQKYLRVVRAALQN